MDGKLRVNLISNKNRLYSLMINNTVDKDEDRSCAFIKSHILSHEFLTSYIFNQ